MLSLLILIYVEENENMPIATKILIWFLSLYIKNKYVLYNFNKIDIYSKKYFYKTQLLLRREFIEDHISSIFSLNK